MAKRAALLLWELAQDRSDIDLRPPTEAEVRLADTSLDFLEELAKNHSIVSISSTFSCSCLRCV